jgi:hypothetical protein
MCVFLFASCGLGEANNTAQSFTTADFQKLRWLEGSWRGTGGGIDPFYEKYHFTNDTTIEIEFFSDASLSKLTEKKNITLENGQIRYGTSASASRLDDKSVDFAAKDYPFSWESDSTDVWTANLYRMTPQGKKLDRAYRMERMK